MSVIDHGRESLGHHEDEKVSDSSATALAEAMPFLGPASVKLLSDGVIEQMRESILQGHLLPGARLREEQLAEALGVSRGPVRSALVQLEREGLVIRRRNRGAVVAGLSKTDLEEVYSLRLAIEPVACRWAARNAASADIEAMRAIIATYSTLLTSDVTTADAASADVGFHDIVYRAARHVRLFRLWHDLRPQVHLFLSNRKYVRSPDFREIMINGHQAIVAAIAGPDPDVAAAVAAEHVRTSYEHVLSEFDTDRTAS
jgi:DNA-binding GntR family transcriptional regulator